MAKAKTVKKGKKLGSVKPLNSFKTKGPGI
jgi:hypothetical protein